MKFQECNKIRERREVEIFGEKIIMNPWNFKKCGNCQKDCTAKRQKRLQREAIREKGGKIK